MIKAKSGEFAIIKMKLLLTSGGIANKTIENEMWQLLGGKQKSAKLLFCTTASNYEGGDMVEWLIQDLIKLKDLGFEIDVCDINGIDKDNFLPRFEWADVLYFEGGNTQWLRKCIKSSGLEEKLPKLLESKVWIGASAGSCVLCPTVVNSVQNLFDETLSGFAIDGLGVVDFQFIPHLDNKDFPKIREENLQKAIKNLKEIDGKYIYICDDNGAVSVDDKNVKVVSEGKVIEKKL
jgi:dipeptidase E